MHAPTLEFAEDYELKTTANVGDYFTFKLSDVVIEDDVDERDEITTQVLLYSPDRRTVQNALEGNEEFSWKLDEVGTYELRIIMTDQANNTKTESFNINVVEDDAKTSVISESTGIALIAVTAVVLAGVVVYFIVNNRSIKTTKGSKRDPKK